MARSTNFCAFCGPPVIANSPEHIWGDWITRLYKKRGLKARFQIKWWNNRGEARARGSQSIDEKALVVCGDCNHHWMSDLETEVSQFLPDLIFTDGNRPVSLSPLQHAALNAWMVKTAMVLDYRRKTETLKGGEPFFLQQQRTSFRNRLKPPSRTLLWIARYEGPSSASGRAITNDFWFRSPRFQNQRGFVITFLVRNLALQLHATRRIGLGGILPPEPASTLPCPDYLITAWPFDSRIAWPPANHFDPDSFKLFANRWSVRPVMTPSPWD